MRFGSLISIVCLVGLLTVLGGGVALGEELDAKWLAGKWTATTPSPAGMGRQDRGEWEVKEDGTFVGEVQSASGSLIPYRDGKWKIDGDSVVFEALLAGGPAVVRNTKVTWTLKRSGADLIGMIVRHYNMSTGDVTWKRAK